MSGLDSAPAPPAPRWSVSLAGVVETAVRLACPPPARRSPWASARALGALSALGASAGGSPRAVGAGRGHPVLSSRLLELDGATVEVEAVVVGEGTPVEVTLRWPAFDELEPLVDEARWWEVVDAVAAAVDARHGALVDGEAIDLADPEAADLAARLRRHAGLLVPERLAPAAGALACHHRTLERSGMAVLLR